MLGTWTQRPKSDDSYRAPTMSTLRLPLLLYLSLLAACSEESGVASAGQAQAAHAGSPEAPAMGSHFRRIASFPAFRNGDVEELTAAEILSASPDGRTLVYTDGVAERLGFIDLSDPYDPRPAGTVAVHGEPTSVAVRGQHALVCVNTSKDHVDTSGVLLVVDLVTHAVVRELELGGQPDSIAVSPDGRYAAIAIENERDEGRDDGALPQDPPGWLTIVDCAGEVAAWSLRRVELTGLAERYPSDPEPEFVDINTRNQAVVTLQENNHLVVVDLVSGVVVASAGCGVVDLVGIDVKANGRIELDGELAGVAREPDAVGWISDSVLATANEGDLDGGSRGFTTWVMGERGAGDGLASVGVAFDSGAALERELVRLGHFPEGRAEAKGVEPEGVEVGVFDGRPLLFVGAERGNALLVYDVSDPAAPTLLQVLPTGVGPEGIVAIPDRGLVAVACEVDARDGGFRSSVMVYALADGPSYPGLVSGDDGAGNPIGWTELSGLAVDPGDDKRMFSVPDGSLRPSSFYTIDASAVPARIVEQTFLADADGVLRTALAKLGEQQLGAPGLSPASDFRKGLDLTACLHADGTMDLDLEGISALADGSLWIVAEGGGRGPRHDGAKGSKFTPNLLLHVAKDGVILEAVTLPEPLLLYQEGAGLEGVAAADGFVYAILQRPWGPTNGPLGRTVLLRFEPATGSWASAYYVLEPPASPAGGWVGVSGLQLLGSGQLAVLERDNQGGTDAAIKRVYTVDLADLAWSVTGDHDSIPVVTKTLLADLIEAGTYAALGAPVPVFVEGLAARASGELLLINDNGGVPGNAGETHLVRLPQK